jgi:hypothetical protein
MEKAAVWAEKVAAFKHPKLSAIKLAGGPQRPADPATLDELIMGIKAALAKLAPIIDLDAVLKPQPRPNSRCAVRRRSLPTTSMPKVHFEPEAGIPEG